MNRSKNGEEVRFFRQFTHKAGSWEHPQRVVVKFSANQFIFFLHAETYMLLLSQKLRYQTTNMGTQNNI